MANIKFVIATTAGYVNKSGLTQNIAQAKSYKSLAGAKQHLTEGAWIERVELATEFGQTSATALGKVDAEEVEAAEALPTVSRDDKAVFVLINADGEFFNKKGFTGDINKALTSPNPDYLAGFVAKSGVPAQLVAGVSRYVDGVYELELGEVVADIPVDVTGVKVVDEEIQVLVKG